MESKNTNIEKSLFNQLEQKGIEKDQIPLFIKDLINIFAIKDFYELLWINYRLHLLGWADFEIDSHTLKLAEAFFRS